MKFICNTKPFADSLGLGIINSNVSNFHQKSCTVELTATDKLLKINIEASQIFTEIHIPGKGEPAEGETSASIFVDSLLLKNLSSTFESQTVTLDFTENGLIITSGKSHFTLPKMVDGSDFDLKAPAVPASFDGAIDLDQSDWKFIKDYQMYAISMAFINPVYTRVWVGQSGDVLVGDFDNSLFTHSKHSKLGKTCLLSDTIINLFNSLPAGSKIIPLDDSYVIQLKTDSYEYLTQFTPLYESDESVGSYNSDIFLGMMQHPDNGVEINTVAVTKALNQALLLSTNSQDSIFFSLEDGQVHLTDKNVDCSIAVKGDTSTKYKVEFNLERLKKVIANYSDETINVSPMEQEGAVVGIMVWNKELTTIVAGLE